MSETRLTTIDELQRNLEASPFHQLFDFEIVETDKERGLLSMLMRYSPAVERSRGSRQYHGGAIASLIDIAGDYVLMSQLGFGVPTINFRVDYLRPATDTDLLAKATIRKAGRTVGVVDIDVTDDKGRLIAIGRGCYGTTAG